MDFEMRLPKWIQRIYLRYTLRHEARYVRRWIVRMKLGRKHSTLGNDLKDEERTRQSAQIWLRYLQSIGLKPWHRCIEVGCGSLWAAEPVIRYLEPGKYCGLDITEYFYSLGQKRLEPLLQEKRVTLAIVSDAIIERLAREQAEFVFARKVLAHVRPDELPRFVSTFCQLLGSRSVGLIDNAPTPTTRERNPGSIDYAVNDIARLLPQGMICSQDEWAIVIRRNLD